MILLLGVALSVAGSIAFAYLFLSAVTVNTNLATANAFAAMGPVLVFIVMLGTLIRPLGLLVLAYGYARFRNALWLALVLAMVCSQLVLGFAADTKTLPLQAGLLVVVARTLVDNRIPKWWVIGAAVAVAIMFPIFQANRAAVVGERGLNRAQAAQDLGRTLQLALEARDKAALHANSRERAQYLFERASTKGNVELAFEHTGVDAPFQYGRTLLDLPLAFIPRLVWPDKPGFPAGQLFNKQIVRGEGDTYISPSHLGELYWNFGWPGLTVGMLLVGMLLGAVGSRSSLAEGISATRLLVLLVTVNNLCIGFEGSIATSYVVWLRSVAAVALLHLLIARRTGGGATDSPVSVRAAPVAALPRFPNILR